MSAPFRWNQWSPAWIIQPYRPNLNCTIRPECNANAYSFFYSDIAGKEARSAWISVINIYIARLETTGPNGCFNLLPRAYTSTMIPARRASSPSFWGTKDVLFLFKAYPIVNYIYIWKSLFPSQSSLMLSLDSLTTFTSLRCTGSALPISSLLTEIYPSSCWAFSWKFTNLCHAPIWPGFPISDKSHKLRQYSNSCL